jgi:hypothetical protein
VDGGRFILIVCIALGAGIGIPALLIFYLKKENSANLVSSLRKGTETARNPWKKTDQDLEELSRRVQALKEHPPQPPAGRPEDHSDE